MGIEIDKIIQVNADTESLVDHLDESRELRKAMQKLDSEVPNLGIKPFSHNIIGLTLSAVADQYGDVVANELIQDYGLEKHGWTMAADEE